METAKPPRSMAGRWYRPAMLGLTVLVLVAGTAVAWAHLGAYTSRGLVGVDLRLFSELGRRWAEDGSMYAPWQFSPYEFNQGSGTNDVERMPGLYPPLAGPVFAVVRLLPPILWWIVPLSVIGWCVVRFRPAPWAWPLMAAALLSPNLTGVLATGGSTMWVTAAVAAGLVWGWPVLLILLKPTFAPLLLIGVTRRSFWLGLGAIAGLSLLMLPEWFRYLEVVRNTHSPGLLYSLGDLPMVLVPLVAWLSRPKTPGLAQLRVPAAPRLDRLPRAARGLLPTREPSRQPRGLPRHLP